MKYRSLIPVDATNPKASDIFVTTTAGHCAVVGPEWRTLPHSLHAAALRSGCEVDSSKTVADEHITPSSPKAVSQDDERGLIGKAIKELLKLNDPEDFTNDGQPKVASVNRQAGFTTTKSDVLAVWEQLNEEAAE